MLDGDSLILLETHFTTDHEGWPRGDPEIIVSTMEWNPDILAFSTNRQCTGDGQPAPFNFDINDAVWAGRGFIGYRSQIPVMPITSPPYRVLAIWEDDTGDKCAYEPEDHYGPLAFTVEHLRQTGHFQIMGRQDYSPSVWEVGFEWAVLTFGWLGYATQDDDLFGVVSLPSTAGEFDDPRDVNRADPDFGGAIVHEGWIRLAIR